MTDLAQARDLLARAGERDAADREAEYAAALARLSADPQGAAGTR